MKRPRIARSELRRTTTVWPRCRRQAWSTWWSPSPSRRGVGRRVRDGLPAVHPGVDECLVGRREPVRLLVVAEGRELPPGAGVDLADGPRGRAVAVLHPEVAGPLDQLGRVVVVLVGLADPLRVPCVVDGPERRPVHLLLEGGHDHVPVDGAEERRAPRVCGEVRRDAPPVPAQDLLREVVDPGRTSGGEVRDVDSLNRRRASECGETVGVAAVIGPACPEPDEDEQPLTATATTTARSSRTSRACARRHGAPGQR